MFEDDDVEFEMDLSLDEGQDSPPLPVHPAVHEAGLELGRANRKSYFSISDATDTLGGLEEEEESNKSPADTFLTQLTAR